MIAGLSHLSTAFSAMRVAEAAQARAEAAREQVATGRRVNSAKDDGAAFTVALAARSEMALWGARDRLLNKLDNAIDVQANVLAMVSETYRAIANLAVKARDTAAGSTERRAIASDYTALTDKLKQLGQFTLPGVDGTPSASYASTDFGIRPFHGDTLVGGQTWSLVTDQQNFSLWADFVNPFAGIMVALRGFDILNATDSQLEDVRATAQIISSGDFYVGRFIAQTSRDAGRAERLLEVVREMQDRMKTAAGQLLDADMGQVSSGLEAAETRAAMAQQGISRAIQLYARQTTAVLDSALTNWSRVRAVA
jgi:flagellin